jgi:Dockerin type I domain
MIYIRNLQKGSFLLLFTITLLTNLAFVHAETPSKLPIDLNTIITDQISTQTIHQKLDSQMSWMSFQEFIAEYGMMDTGLKADRDIAYYRHPALGDAGNDTLARLYEGYDGVSPLPLVYINGSQDNGANWEYCCWIDLAGGTFPSVEYWGSETQFYSSFVPPSTFQNGGAFMVVSTPDPIEPTTWNVGWAGSASFGFYDMKMVDIASDNGQQTWNWGFVSAVINLSQTGDDLIDVPVIYGWDNGLGSGYISYFGESFDNCLTTDADIDHVTGKTYAVYDRYNDSTDQYQLVIRQDHFYDWDEGTDGAGKYYADSNQHIINPVIVAHNDNILLAAAVYHDDFPADIDIICWFTDDGDVDSLNDMSVIAATIDAENFPEISHVENTTFVCTYVSNNILYACRTIDAGATWSTPEQVSDPAHLVTEDVRCTDIADGGNQVIYEYTAAKSEDTFITTIDLYLLDSDGDGVYFYTDNCPSANNPLQENGDGDVFGDECDNCPLITNHTQADSDNDEIGDDCDDCPDDPLNDEDGDLYCAADDNCPVNYNPGQDDSDFDGIGNACDNCPDDDNFGQEDADLDGEGDLCDDCTDTDGDTYGNPGYPANTCPPDNCPGVYNPAQTDSDFDGAGDACDICGNANGDEAVNVSDAVFIINYVFVGGLEPYPYLAADANCDSTVDVSDAVWIINYIFVGGFDPCDADGDTIPDC